MISYKPGWNMEIRSYANRFGPYQAFVKSFDENAINRALFDAQGKFTDVWVKKFLQEAMDPFDKQHVVKLEQGTHQTENMTGGGFCLHFTGRDSDGIAFHFYVNQQNNGSPRIFEITYMDGGRLVSCKRTG